MEFYFLLAVVSNVNGQGGVLPLNGSVYGNIASSSTDTWDVTTNADGLLRLTTIKEFFRLVLK